MSQSRPLLCLVAIVLVCYRGMAETKSLAEYETQLSKLRAEFGGCKSMPDVRFFLFGMGNRSKFVYRQGTLFEALSTNVVAQWPIQRETILPHLYAVELQLTNGATLRIFEDEQGVWITAPQPGIENSKEPPKSEFQKTPVSERARVAERPGKAKLLPGTDAPIVLPDFSAFKYALVLRVLHHELLINVLDGKPLPNFLVYTKPWRRDAAMMAMCFQKTGNLLLIRDWALSLRDPYDHNNKSNGVGEDEADNLGQTLFLISLFSDANHPAVTNVLAQIPRFLVRDGRGQYIRGRSDFHETPLYQTKWLKFGLRALELPDPYYLPDLSDDYSSLFWWDYLDGRAGDEPKADDYPYLGWARDHFHRRKRNPISDHSYPLTWEMNASQADYAKMAVIAPEFVAARNAMPHSWHAAEVFLYLLELK